jgi:acetyl esterase
MALHPQVEEMMAQRATLNMPELWTLSPQEARDQMAAMAPQVEGEAVKHVEDRTIPGPAGEIPIRIYRPADGTLPALV